MNLRCQLSCHQMFWGNKGFDGQWKLYCNHVRKAHHEFDVSRNHQAKREAMGPFTCPIYEMFGLKPVSTKSHKSLSPAPFHAHMRSTRPHRPSLPHVKTSELSPVVFTQSKKGEKKVNYTWKGWCGNGHPCSLTMITTIHPDTNQNLSDKVIYGTKKSKIQQISNNARSKGWHNYLKSEDTLFNFLYSIIIKTKLTKTRLIHLSLHG